MNIMPMIKICKICKASYYSSVSEILSLHKGVCPICKKKIKRQYK